MTTETVLAIGTIVTVAAVVTTVTNATIATSVRVATIVTFAPTVAHDTFVVDRNICVGERPEQWANCQQSAMAF